MSDDRVFAKCAWRLIPFMMLLYVVNYLDRVNVGFAALTMNKDLGFTPVIYGFGAGLFYLGYLLFQVPASIVLTRIGARRSIFAILTLWGAVSASTSLVQERYGFYAARFLLGAAEAGFFPVMIVYLASWFPRSFRGRFTALFMMAIPMSSVLGGPLSSLILQMQGVAGLQGWQWLFLIEGLPACALGIVVFFLLPDQPGRASWLSAEEKATIASRAVEDVASESRIWSALSDPRVWALGIVNVALLLSNGGLQLWLPQIVQAMGFSNLAVGFVVAVPYVVALPVMVIWGRSGDLRNERVWHLALPALLAACGFAVASLSRSDIVSLFAIGTAAVGLATMTPAFFSLITSFLRGPAAAAGIALTLSIGNLGSFLGPNIVGILKQQTGAFTSAMVAFAGALFVASLIILIVIPALSSRPATAQPAGAE
jgi:ACS family tartrate transporter-like MFS transporter